MENTKGTATYCPEDNKIRLYVGRVPKEDYLRLKAAGFTSTPKQACDFVATWTPSREDLALEFADLIEDEDQTPEERAADRAERFSEYRDKRLSEAVGHADRFDAGPSVHGFQDYGRAVRSADRHDRIAGRAVSAWDKAEYWQRRTAGVISHALYKSEPGVRMGRINTLESELRKHKETAEEYRKAFTLWKRVEAETDPENQFKLALHLANTSGLTIGGYDFKHPRPEQAREYYRTNGTSLYSLLTCPESPITGAEAAALWLKGRRDPDSEEFSKTSLARWIRHLELRLAYERQMLEAQGGRMEQVEVEAGGKFGGKLILKVNKSAVTKRAKSVWVLTTKVQGWHYKVRNIPGTEWAEAQFDLERYAPEMYQAPTPESLEELKRVREAIKGVKPEVESVPLVNPTDEDAQRLQDYWNALGLAGHNSQSGAQYMPPFQPVEILRMTQAEYSERSKGSYATCAAVEICENAMPYRAFSNLYAEARKAKLESQGKPLVKIRLGRPSGDYQSHRPKAIIVLTDKPRKPLPVEVWDGMENQVEEVAA